MTIDADLAHCRAAIRTGSLSFHAASRLLPRSVRDPALVLYAFCRIADDAVDEGTEKAGAVLTLHERLDRIYAGRPRNTPVDRAFARVVETFDMPRALPDALLEGLAWDARGDRYRSLSEIRDYSARVAAAVGVMMCVLMRVRDAHALARACDLGVAMQLTNIARDVGEDARAGRLYVPLDWFEEAGLDPDFFLHAPLPTPEVCSFTARLLSEAARLYRRSEAGIRALPLKARTGIWAARLIYDGIGGRVRANACDSITMRAHTGRGQKLGWLAQATARTIGGGLMPRSPVLFAPPLPECRFLVDAAATTPHDAGPSRAEALIGVLAELKARDAGIPRQSA